VDKPSALEGTYQVAGPYDPGDDAALIERSRIEPGLFAGIFDRHATEIHRYAARRLGDALAEDIVGETFLTAFRNRDRYDLAYRDARPWLFGIATNMISRHRQREVRSLRALARTGIDPVTESPADDVVMRVTATTECRRIATMLARLRPAERDTLLLVDWAGLSYEETAQTLGIAVGTVRSRLSRARRRIREALGGVNPLSAAENP
jgi:RNA polymerase sigma-70 factor (ECF subfamily)